jgi:hypothetical protein
MKRQQRKPARPVALHTEANELDQLDLAKRFEEERAALVQKHRDFLLSLESRHQVELLALEQRKLVELGKLWTRQGRNIGPGLQRLLEEAQRGTAG